MRKILITTIAMTFFLLVGCGKESLFDSTATLMPTATQPIPTATSTPTRLPTITPATPLFPVFTPDWFPLDTPTPIATPAKNSNDFRLVDWNEEKAIELVHQMEQYAYARDIPGMSENRFMFQEDQVYSELAVREALARYPESKY